MGSIFQGLFDSSTTSVIALSDFMLCVVCALVLGLVIALSYMHKTRFTKSFVVTLAMLPAVVCVVIMMVNGNVGTGVAVAGAFGLIRFRSVPGTAKEIGMIFLAMGCGLICAMGYLAYAALFTLIMCAVFIGYGYINFGDKNADKYKTIRITIPEDLNYHGVFEEIFDEYTTSYKLIHVKTTNLGSMFKLTYNVILKDPLKEKELIDKIRCRNGNLEIVVSMQEAMATEL